MYKHARWLYDYRVWLYWAVAAGWVVADDGAAGAPQGNARPAPPFAWTPKREKAAAALAALGPGETEEELALRLGVTFPTLWRWKQHPAFAARVAEHTADIVAAVKAEGVANRQNRLDGYNDRYRRLEQVIAERAADPTMAQVPGGTSGLLAREIKFVTVYEAKRPERGGDDGEPAIVPAKYKEPTEVFTVDTGLLRELREVAKQAAQDLGQWTEKREIGGADGEPALKVYVGVALEDV